MSNSRYEAGASTVEQMLAPDSTVFEIPEFQRGYAWKKEHVENLLDDLYGDESWQEPDHSLSPYFLGSIVLSKKQGGPDSVLDGQQRLTTISLLLAILRYELKLLGDNDTANDIQKFLVSGRIGQQKSPKVKLQPEDAMVFSSLIENPYLIHNNVSDFMKHPIAQAAKQIDTSIKIYREQATERQVSDDNCLRLMATKILYGVEFVRIVAPTESEAFRLFETLNDRGLPLSAADLIKNKLFAHSGEYLSDVKKFWQYMVYNVGLEEVVSFLRYLWIAKYDVVHKNGLYDKFLEKIQGKNAKYIYEFVNLLYKTSEIYQNIAKPDPSSCLWGAEAGESLVRLNVFHARSCRPFLIACANDPHLEKKMPFVIQVCENITMRYSIIGERNPNQLERFYGNICVKIRNSDFNDDIEKIIIDNAPQQMPNDAEFQEKFASMRIDRVTKTWRNILIRLNEIISSGETSVLGTKNVEVEHILPRNLTPEVCKESNISEEQGKDLIDRVGNITLLSRRKNREIQNLPFSEKRHSFESSEITLTRSLAKYTRWGEEEIEERSRELAKIAVKAWKWPVI